APPPAARPARPPPRRPRPSPRSRARHAARRLARRTAHRARPRGSRRRPGRSRGPRDRGRSPGFRRWPLRSRPGSGGSTGVLLTPLPQFVTEYSTIIEGVHHACDLLPLLVPFAEDDDDVVAPLGHAYRRAYRVATTTDLDASCQSRRRRR